MRHLELHIFPWIGALAMKAILPTEVVRSLHRIKERGNLETAQRVREAVQHVFQYAVDVGTLEPARNFVNSRTAGLPPPRTRHYAAITDPQKLDQLLRDIRAYNGNVITRAALQLSVLVVPAAWSVAVGALGRWDLDQALWRCPPEKMKLREWKKRDVRMPAHLVPLPTGGRDSARHLSADGALWANLPQYGEAFREDALHERQHRQQRTAHVGVRLKGADYWPRVRRHGPDSDPRAFGGGP